MLLLKQHRVKFYNMHMSIISFSAAICHHSYVTKM